MNHLDRSAFNIHYASVFDEYRKIEPIIINKWTDVILDLVNNDTLSKKTILDAGAGTGRFTLPIATNVERFGINVYALEKSNDMLKILKDKCTLNGIRNVSFYNDDLTNLTLKNSFTGIFISEVLHLLDNLDLVCKQLFNSLEKGGWIVIRTSSHNQLKKIEWLKHFPQLLQMDLERTTDISGLRQSLNNAGFENIKTTIIDESKFIPTPIYLEMLFKKAYSIIYKCTEDEFRQGYSSVVDSVTKSKSSDCRHTMEFTCLIAKKAI